MADSITDRLDDVPFRPLKAGETALQKLKGEETRLNPDAGEVLDLARSAARLEPKQMADDMRISHSLVLRGLKSVDHLSFHRLWMLSDDFWTELIVAIAKKRLVVGVDVSTAITIRRLV